MNQPTLRDRVTFLEQEVAEFKRLLANGVRVNDWRSTFGMFTGDEIMKQIDEEARKIREADRHRARQRAKKHRRATK
jgi:hypothetical protein